MLQWMVIVLYYEFGWNFSRRFSFRFIVTCYRVTDDACYISWFPWVTYHKDNERALDFISAKFSLISPKGICFFIYHVKEELLWNVEIFSLCLYVCQLVTFAMLPWMGMPSLKGKGFFLEQTEKLIFPSKPKWGNVRQIFGKSTVKFSFRHFPFNEAL